MLKVNDPASRPVPSWECTGAFESRSQWRNSRSSALRRNKSGRSLPMSFGSMKAMRPGLSLRREYALWALSVVHRS